MKIVLDIDYEEKSPCTNPLSGSKKDNVLRCGSCLSCKLERKVFRAAYKKALCRELYKLGWSKEYEKTK